jgi:hypothetical protein
LKPEANASGEFAWQSNCWNFNGDQNVIVAAVRRALRNGETKSNRASWFDS